MWISFGPRLRLELVLLRGSSSEIGLGCVKQLLSQTFSIPSSERIEESKVRPIRRSEGSMALVGPEASRECGRMSGRSVRCP